jgi:hypothetical protein
MGEMTGTWIYDQEYGERQEHGNMIRNRGNDRNMEIVSEALGMTGT